MFHVGECWCDLLHIVSALRFGADVVLLQGGYSHWYLFSVLRLFRIQLIPVLMIVLWPKHKPLGRVKRFIWWLNGWFFGAVRGGIVTLRKNSVLPYSPRSPGGRPAPIQPTYPGSSGTVFFKPMSPPRRRPSGAVRRTIVRLNGRRLRPAGDHWRFAAEGITDIEFDLCGDGMGMDELKCATSNRRG